MAKWSIIHSAASIYKVVFPLDERSLEVDLGALAKSNHAPAGIDSDEMLPVMYRSCT